MGVVKKNVPSNSTVAKTGVVPIYDTSESDGTIKQINKELSTIEWQGNVLRKYSTPTYILSMYMLPYEVEQALDVKCSSAGNYESSIESTAGNIADENKYYIFYEGISADFSVEELSLTSYMGPNNYTRNSQYLDMKLVLKEINNCAFAEKIRQMSLALGYDNYWDVPYYIDILFLGYTNEISKAKHDMPARVHLDATPYEKDRDAKFTYKVAITEAKPTVDDYGTTWALTLVPHSGNAKDAEVMLIGDANVIKFDSKFTDFIQNLENRINTIRLPKYRGLYKGTIPAKLVEFELDDSVKDLTISEKIKSTEEKSNSKTTVTFSPNNSIPMCIETIFKNIETDKSSTYIPRVITRKELVGKMNDGTLLYRWIHKICAMKTSYVTAEEAKDTPSAKNEAALTHLKEIKKSGTFIKKYQYYNTGVETEVIKFSPLFNNMYFIPAINSILPSKQNNALGNTTENKEIEAESNNSANIEKLAKMTDVNAMVTQVNKKYAKYKSNSGLFLLNDFYRGIQKDGYRKPPVRPVTLVDVNQEDTNPDNIDTYKKELMYKDIFSSGNAIQMKLTIHGDPYWLGNPVTGAPTPASYRDMNYHKFAFKYAGPHNSNETCYFGFNGIYTVITVTSIFSNGDFKQEIDAVADEKFYHRTDWKF